MTPMLYNSMPLLDSGRPAADDSCCCGGCADASPDTDTQESVTISGADGCTCKTGDHNGTYDFSDHYLGVWTWYGTSDCEMSDYSEMASMNITVQCDEATDKWKVNVTSYQYDNQALEGELLTDDLSVDDDDKFTGTVTVEMYDDTDTYACDFVLAF